MRRPFHRWPVALLLTLVLVGVVWMLLQPLFRGLLYPAPGLPLPAPPPAPLEPVPLALAAGGATVAWALDGSRPGAPVVLLFHGNGENLETMRRSGTLEAMSALGVAVLAVEYPGYGGTGGSPSEARNAQAADAALAHARERWPGRPVVPVGWSLGAAVAAGVADRAQHAGAGVDALVLLSPWTRLEEVARRHFPAPLVKLALAERYDSLALVPGLRSPALVIHGMRDRLIPAEHGERVAAALPRGRFVAIPEAGHNDLLAQPRVWRELGSFLHGVQQARPQQHGQPS